MTLHVNRWQFWRSLTTHHSYYRRKPIVWFIPWWNKLSSWISWRRSNRCWSTMVSSNAFSGLVRQREKRKGWRTPDMFLIARIVDTTFLSSEKVLRRWNSFLSVELQTNQINILVDLLGSMPKSIIQDEIITVRVYSIISADRFESWLRFSCSWSRFWFER